MGSSSGAKSTLQDPDEGENGSRKLQVAWQVASVGLCWCMDVDVQAVQDVEAVNMQVCRPLA